MSCLLRLPRVCVTHFCFRFSFFFSTPPPSRTSRSAPPEIAPPNSAFLSLARDSENDSAATHIFSFQTHLLVSSPAWAIERLFLPTLFERIRLMSPALGGILRTQVHNRLELSKNLLFFLKTSLLILLFFSRKNELQNFQKIYQTFFVAVGRLLDAEKRPKSSSRVFNCSKSQFTTHSYENGKSSNLLFETPILLF